MDLRQVRDYRFVYSAADDVYSCLSGSHRLEVVIRV